MGVLPAPPAIIPTVRTDRYAVAGKPHASFNATIQPITPTVFRVLGFKGVTWSAVQFQTQGVYTVRTHDLGIAEHRTGNTRGQELVANWRLTCGSDILPAMLPGYSSAGMERVHLDGKGWRYVRRTPVPYDKAFQIIVTPTTVTLRVNDMDVWSMERNDQPALLAFKNLWLDVTYAETESPKPDVPKPEASPKPILPKYNLATAASRGAVNYAAAARGELKRNDLDLPPAALIAKLREAASTT